jgi:hypothetical protein
MTGNATVREIVKAGLCSMGANGLFNETARCGCPIGDLMPCDSPCDECEPAMRVYCPNCGEDVYVPVGTAWQKHGSA